MKHLKYVCKNILRNNMFSVNIEHISHVSASDHVSDAAYMFPLNLVFEEHDDLHVILKTYLDEFEEVKSGRYLYDHPRLTETEYVSYEICLSTVIKQLYDHICCWPISTFYIMRMQKLREFSMRPCLEFYEVEEFLFLNENVCRLAKELRKLDPGYAFKFIRDTIF